MLISVRIQIYKGALLFKVHTYSGKQVYNMRLLLLISIICIYLCNLHSNNCIEPNS